MDNSQFDAVTVADIYHKRFLIKEVIRTSESIYEISYPNFAGLFWKITKAQKILLCYLKINRHWKDHQTHS